MKKQPKFWRKKTSIYSDALIPFGVLYYVASLIKAAITSSYKPKAKVVCIGNATVGGAGKTPVAMAIYKLIEPLGKKVAFLSKGYGGNIQGPVEVDCKKHRAEDVGDEPLLLAATAPTAIAHNRVDGIRFLEEQGSEIIIMDDGLQNYSITKDISFLVVDGNYGFGNQRVLPSGPLREPVHAALKKSDAVIFVGDDTNKVKESLKGNMVVNAQIDILSKKPSEGSKFIAFAGIANPDKFFDSLEKTSHNVVDAICFPDHHNYTKEELSALSAAASEVSAKLITTSKDYVRLSPENRESISVLPIEIKWNSSAKLVNLLKEKLK